MFTKSTYLIKEQVSFLKLHDTFDIIDPENGQKIGYAKETISVFIKLLRLVINKRMLPTKVGIFFQEQEVLVLEKSGLFIPKVLLKKENELIAIFKSKLFSIGGAFYVYDKDEREIATLKGDWKGWNFILKNKEGLELGKVTKKWAGIGKELFTSADNYVISLNEEGAKDKTQIGILISAALSIDIIFKEKK